MFRSLAVSVLGVAGARSLAPHSVDFADLVDDVRFGQASIGFKTALGFDGLLQVAGIPGFAALRERVLHEAHACIAEAPHAQELTFDDGTVRRTLAAAEGVTFGLQGMDHGTDTEACLSFERSGKEFRDMVSGVADTFAKRLGDALNLSDRRKILDRRSGESYNSLEEVVHSGERLHHFHSYQLPSLSESSERPTMDFHVDQGLFISFAPALMVDRAATSAWSSGSFVVKTRKGEEVDMDFQPSALVFVLGDAVNQVFHGHSLHAPSHAFQMPRDGLGLHRVWYGMMQLPPSDAMAADTGPTFGELRSEVIKASSDGGIGSEAILSLGCSRKLQARELSPQCTETQILCWHRCYDFTEEVSPDACKAQNSDYNCTNQFDQIYISGHGDYQPKCTNSTEMYSPRPVVVQPTGACNEWTMAMQDSTYPFKMALYEDETYLMWKVMNGELEARMIHKGLVGWMAVGMENIGGGKNGMYGSSIVMGRVMDSGSTTVKEYRISNSSSAFRHWATPHSPSALGSEEISSSGCMTSMAFKTSSIFGKNLNLTEGMSNRLIWGLTHGDYSVDEVGGYSGYHGNGNRTERPRFRGLVHLDLVAGTPVTGDQPTGDESTDGAPQKFGSLVVVAAAALALLRTSA